MHTEKTGMEPGGARQTSGGVLQYVRTAEELIRRGNYDVALEALAVAKELEPLNPTLQTLIEKVLLFQAQQATSGSRTLGVPGLAEKGGRYLGITVGKEFRSGIRSRKEAPGPSPREVHERVGYLLDVADVFMMRGMNECAFESLMCAYLLDPLAPEVIRSEEKILPVLAAMGSGPEVLRATVLPTASLGAPRNGRGSWRNLFRRSGGTE
jgi:hypothetical protein